MFHEAGEHLSRSTWKRYSVYRDMWHYPARGCVNASFYSRIVSKGAKGGTVAVFVRPARSTGGNRSDIIEGCVLPMIGIQERGVGGLRQIWTPRPKLLSPSMSRMSKLSSSSGHLHLSPAAHSKTSICLFGVLISLFHLLYLFISN